MNDNRSSLDRRSFLSGSVSSMGVLSLGTTFTSMASANPWFETASLKSIGALQRPDSNGIRLPEGFTSRQVANSGSTVRRDDGSSTGYRWHDAPDGGAVFGVSDGGWIYTSNSETSSNGGAGALRFNGKGDLIDAYSILSGTDRNCAGGPTPWGTWLSCEETSRGQVYECDVFGRGASLRRGLGTFKHEAVAIDPAANQAYLTEDTGDGCFYRYTPSSISNGVMNLDQGLLEVAIVDGRGNVDWAEISNPNPSSRQTATRYQVRSATEFDGGEGIWYHDGDVYFTTKGDNRVWRYNIQSRTIGITYDRRSSSNPILSGVDNVTVTSDGHVLVAEDGGDMQIVVLGPYGDVYPLLQIVNESYSEITGPAITPSGDRMYFSSQRGGTRRDGATYEILGKFG
ncbi:alkaline phosphatase PhoX [Pseudobacteriovorax antillogorgiicola]|uniref:WD40-like Beta Propeller Repeat n=1 Tax=Pseudobacteriovorax antillogorgiicola TaxID=1513793 RepID=A0A1Y6CIG7_9BACT|nr:alkaline phosphatase PhoX [Pseudobacteriovorax antillogorgiicola]TCS46923.1 WD40 repeat protein [Pseudobacteriovorax antillogorgiicola]SMF64240.1 WD40-like Beta Propeller Repeat [Pseudobacteriovorax antillogorgiicola]